MLPNTIFLSPKYLQMLNQNLSHILVENSISFSPFSLTPCVCVVLIYILFVRIRDWRSTRGKWPLARNSLRPQPMVPGAPKTHILISVFLNFSQNYLLIYRGITILPYVLIFNFTHTCTHAHMHTCTHAHTHTCTPFNKIVNILTLWHNCLEELWPPSNDGFFI